MARQSRVRDQIGKQGRSIPGKYENVSPPSPGARGLAITAQSVKAHALDTFGSAEKAAHWMGRPNPLLDGKMPRQVIQSDPFSVEAALTRIDHGVYV
jgi:uncharacterized protein (DUF2384 family)